MKKRIIAGIVCAGLLLQTAGAATFTDVGDDYAWAKDAISTLADKEIILGVSEGIFAPEENVTREQLAALVVRALEIKGETPDKNSFTDVDQEMWSYEAVELAKELFGLQEGAFEPEKAADRLTVASVLVNAIEKEKIQVPDTDNKKEFSDTNNLTDAQKTAVEKAAGWGIVNGYPDESFGPEKNVTRAEVAVMIDRVLKLKESSEPSPTASSVPTASPTASGQPTATPSPTATAKPTETPASSSRGEFLVVKEVGTITNSDGETATKITGYLNGETVTIDVVEGNIKDSSGIEKNGNKVQVGDVVTYLKDIKGDVRECVILFKANAAVDGRKIVNPYGDDDMKVERTFGYFNMGYGLVRRVQSGALELVYDDTVELGTSGKSEDYSIAKNVNIYLYDTTTRQPEVKLSDIGDISADKNVGTVPESDEGNFVLVREKDDMVTDLLILNGDFS